ncbi:MAG: alpha/beta hydrolase [Ruminococcus sp.]|nr:alpha/beta hydrolase [Ruminococcus sp.]
MSKSKKNAVLFPDNKNGIYLYEYPVINGIKQYVQVRGTDRKNPLILFIHGGPGGSLAGLCHVLQADWEEKYTVANWDQRNACKTFLANKDNAMKIAMTGTMEDFIKDIDEVIAYLHTVYDFDKLILMGFS